ncbi:MAG: CRISPR-associated endonuclease Cas3'' [Clostridiales bacterium]|nr:CRISPR-associated endonuclease Cas3'' [Clostridiales bacterium]
MTYYARSANATGQKETVTHHLTRAGELCAQFLSPLGYEDWGKSLGETHDFGKLSLRFDLVLKRQKTGVNHALPGAVLLTSMYASRPNTAHLLVAAVASHHSCLQGYDRYESTLKAVRNGTGKNLDAENREYSLFGPEEYQQAISEWRKDFARRRLAPAPSFQGEEDALLSKMLFQRFLFSALVDADWSSSAEHFEPDYLAQHTGPALDPETALQRLLDIRREKQQCSTASPTLNRMRDELFDACLAAGDEAPGLFTLTAPTGLGKTLALLAFALRHCQHWGKRRVVLVLPYLTLIEQNCRDYRAVIPELLELHSNVHWTEAEQLLAQRWDAPCIVTTNVSFFEPLFSAHPGQCRHLHQLADSVIVLDEAQSLPPRLLNATLRTVKLLCDHYGCTVLFSTATQPSFQHRSGLNWQPREIAPDPPALFAATRRVTWHWRLKEPISLSDLSEELSGFSQVCVIVNLRRHARSILQSLCQLCPVEEVFYLSTDLCPAHRSDVLGEVRRRLREGLPCRLVATQCVEAGVDLDFPVLYRALAPLDSLIQAAGRCNRNGDSPAGQMTVFLPDEERLYPTEYYGRGAQAVIDLLSRHEIDCNDPTHIDEYYQLLYQNDRGDKKELREAIQREDYPETEKQYQIIDQAGVQVIVPYTGQLELYKEICRQLDRDGLTGRILQMAKELTVSCYDEKAVRKNCVPLFHRSYEAGQEVPTKYYLLGIPDFYSEKQGLHFEELFNGIY